MRFFLNSWKEASFVYSNFFEQVGFWNRFGKFETWLRTTDAHGLIEILSKNPTFKLKFVIMNKIFFVNIFIQKIFGLVRIRRFIVCEHFTGGCLPARRLIGYRNVIFLWIEVVWIYTGFSEIQDVDKDFETL